MFSVTYLRQPHPRKGEVERDLQTETETEQRGKIRGESVSRVTGLEGRCSSGGLIFIEK